MIKIIKEIGLTTQIFIGLLLGIVFGYVFPDLALDIKPIGDVFLRMIKMIVVPLIFSSLIMGIASTGDFKRLGKLGFRTLIWFSIATTLALIIGAGAVNIFKPGVGVVITNVNVNIVSATAKKSIDLVEMLVNVVPTNIIDAMVQNNMLQIVFFSTFFGIAISSIGKKGEPIITLANSLAEAMFKFTMYIMQLAPIGVFATMAYTVSKFGIGMLLPLGKLIIVLYLALTIFVVCVLISATYIAKVNFWKLMKFIKEPLLLAFTTASSETALPMLIEKLEKFGIPKNIVTFVLSTGYSFNLDGATLYTALAVFFIGQVYGIPLDLSQQVLIVLTLMLTTKGMATVPGGAMIAIAATTNAFGLPMEGIALILGVDRILDMGRTVVNVMGNAIATVIIARWESGLVDNELNNLANNEVK